MSSHEEKSLLEKRFFKQTTFAAVTSSTLRLRSELPLFSHAGNRQAYSDCCSKLPGPMLLNGPVLMSNVSKLEDFLPLDDNRPVIVPVARKRLPSVCCLTSGTTTALYFGIYSSDASVIFGYEDFQT